MFYRLLIISHHFFWRLVPRGVAERLGGAWDFAACLAAELARYVACFVRALHVQEYINMRIYISCIKDKNAEAHLGGQ